MWGAAAQAEARPRAQAKSGVDILSLTSAVPEYKMSQQEVLERAKSIFPQFAKLADVFANSGVEQRYCCEAADWYFEPRGWEERTHAFKRHGTDLIEQVARNAVAAAGIGFRDIDVVVLSTSSGLAVPSLEAHLLDRLDFTETVERVPIVGLGCGGGLGGLMSAMRIAQGMPGGYILYLVVELNTLCFRANDTSQLNFISMAMFGDGAAGMVLRSSGGAAAKAGPSRGRLHSPGHHFWRGTGHISAFEIKDDGMELVLSRDLPQLLDTQFGSAVDIFLKRNGLALRDFEGFLFHPGAAKVLKAMQAALGIDRSQVACSWKVLAEYSNMSAPTVLFVLEAAMNARSRGRHLLCSLGPGMSAYFVVVDL
jgi:alkylresorcinol/alkylpyrone synthase